MLYVTFCRIRSTGVADRFQHERLGAYSFARYRHGRKVYKKRKDGDIGEERDQFVYYQDWGPNSGSNWMIGVNSRTNSRSSRHTNLQFRLRISVFYLNYNVTCRGIESQNMERGQSYQDDALDCHNICVTDAIKVGPFRVSEGN